MQATRRVLGENGNTSSACVLLVLGEMRKRSAEEGLEWGSALRPDCGLAQHVDRCKLQTDGMQRIFADVLISEVIPWCMPRSMQRSHPVNQQEISMGIGYSAELDVRTRFDNLLRDLFNLSRSYYIFHGIQLQHSVSSSISSQQETFNNGEAVTGLGYTEQNCCLLMMDEFEMVQAPCACPEDPAARQKRLDALSTLPSTRFSCPPPLVHVGMSPSMHYLDDAPRMHVMQACNVEEKKDWRPRRPLLELLKRLLALEMDYYTIIISMKLIKRLLAMHPLRRHRRSATCTRFHLREALLVLPVHEGTRNSDAFALRFDRLDVKERALFRVSFSCCMSHQKEFLEPHAARAVFCG
ncbi:hypothetical protein MUK42_09317 [Musa troglodytarum]|uniref:Chalcone/stilbene synthase C-terminal domain-containing protein n=1 Tax=Musa troglodytarum TaxID=320322 RepID=A0A9E7L5F4_9LILI|nr:hypothetical protein MUK42_09317 [Musa troglodytarum]